MKICPTCQQQFPNGFQYCPTDTDQLLTAEEFLRRTRPIERSAYVEPPPVQNTYHEPANYADYSTPETPHLHDYTTRDYTTRETVAYVPAPEAPAYQPPTGSGNYGHSPSGRSGEQAAPPRGRVTQPPVNPSVPSAQPSRSNARPQPAAPPQRQAAGQSQAPAQPPVIHQNHTASTGASGGATNGGWQKTNGTHAAGNGANGRGQNFHATEAAALSFAIPEAGSLFSRLSSALGNVSEAFKSVKQADTGDFTFLLKDESLLQRFGRELGSATQEFARDPKAFTVSLIKGEGSNKQRQRWILNGAAMAVITYSFLFLLIPAILMLVFGWGRPATLAKEEEERLEKLVDIAEMPKIETKVEKAPKESPKGKGGFTGGSKPIIKQASGGGGGGRQQMTPPSKGVPPPMALTPQIVMPNPEPPKIKNPSLAVVPTLYGDPKALPPMKGPTGDPLGVPAPPSSGPGKGAGIGTGEGTGVGRGEGGGAGAGRGGNAGGGDMGLGGGRGNGGSGGIEEMGKNGVGKPVILFKEKARYTEEARQNKVQGTVVLSVIFTADGRISNIRTVRGLPDGLTEKAIEAASRIRFQPATKNGQPVSVRGNLEFTFNLY